MQELVDDPRVLEAALALVDDCYASSKKGGSVVADGSGPCWSEGSASHGRRQHELTRLRLTIRELLLGSVERRQETDTGKRDDQNTDAREHDEEIARAIRMQARRVLKAVRSYNQRLRTAHWLTCPLGESVSVRAVDDQRMVVSLRSRLDTLTRIARANCSSSLPTPVVFDKPIIVAGAMKDTFRYGYHIPFKPSVAADAVWELMQLMHYGRDSQVDELFTDTAQNELVGMVSITCHTVAGTFSATGVTAIRRVFEDDGSVLFVYARIGSDAVNSTASASANLLAGCVFKEAGWTRISRAQQSSRTRPLVLMELAQNLVVEPVAGRSVSKRQLLGFWDAELERSKQDPHSGSSLENRLMDLSIKSGTSSS